MKYLLKIVKWVSLSFVTLCLLISIVVFAYMRLDKFGAESNGKRLAEIQKSENFKDGEFHNEHDTPPLSAGY